VFGAITERPCQRNHGRDQPAARSRPVDL
jgi:hypothetical protein